MAGVAALACLVNFCTEKSYLYYLVIFFGLLASVWTSTLVYLRGKNHNLIGRRLWCAFHFFIGFSGALTIAIHHKAI